MKLKEGITFSHEHITIDLSGVKNNPDCRLDCFHETKAELQVLKSKNVANIIDLTNRGMGRDIPYLTRMSEETGINILCATGYYKEPFFPEEVHVLSASALAEIMTQEILQGIDESGVRPHVIGEIGTSENRMTALEKKVFEASAMCHLETGKPIITHTTLGTFALEQVALFKHYGVNLDQVIISHVDLKGDLDYILRLIDSGVNVAFDTIGKENYLSDALRVSMLKAICDRGLEQKVVMSMDITRKSALAYKGGLGYAYLLDSFIPRLVEAGVPDAAIDAMTQSNIRRIL